ncbi:glycosyltransferase [Sphingobacterium faecium]|uniref:glycosyltransferase n=1 Tax=Sphingobacterium faecium TaxID=34087 RepID=UPI0024698617|nr:glycosyltransferase [Sphingobacterium faecium]MDH5828685.1 glycosyltransferase [Sphingobacterium faecium]
MKVLHIINNLGNGGAERLLVDFLPQLKAQHCEVSLLVLIESTSLSAYVEELRAAGVSVHFLKHQGSLYDIRLLFTLNKFLNRGDYAIVHAHLFPAFYYAAIVRRLFLRKEQYFFTEHSIHNRRIGDLKFKYLEKWIYKSFQYVIVISGAIKEKLDTWIGSSARTVVVQNGMALDKLRAAKAIDLVAIDKGLGHADNKHILMTARFDHPKRQDQLIRVAKLLPENYVLVFAGVGPQLNTCRLLAEELSISHRVFFLGHRSDIASLMKSVDLNVLYTEFEGMSGVTIEALASGKPFLGSDVPGINDIVPSALNLFKNYETTEIVDKIIALCSQEDQSLIDLQMLQSERFTMAAMVAGYLKMYLNESTHAG